MPRFKNIQLIVTETKQVPHRLVLMAGMLLGQAYAGVQAKLYIDLGITNATIFDAGAGAVLIAKLPNPEYFAGAVGGYYDIGIASGNFSYEFEYGTNCRPGANPLSQLDPDC